MLTNEVQTAYAETEGYVPVTSKAQGSAEYQDYLSRCGEDNGTYYDIKIKASKLLLSHVEDTFVTPVFNGSASLRDAAGQLIENTVKSVRRGQQVDGQYIEKLYSDTISLYRLNQLGRQSGSLSAGKEELGKLPGTSVILLSSLAGAWALILFYVAAQVVKKKRNK